MVEKKETICPPFSTPWFEWLYRLKSEPLRRMKRLILTLPSGLLTCIINFEKTGLRELHNDNVTQMGRSIFAEFVEL